MEFRLIYQGPLPSSGGNSRARFKHNLLKHFHRQLAYLWEVQQPLAGIAKQHNSVEDNSTGTVVRREWTGLDELADIFTDKQGIRWAPLINTRYGLVCELDILFLRRANLGAERVRNLFLRCCSGIDQCGVFFDDLAIPRCDYPHKRVHGY